ncbi:type II toxin-antitoxin system RelE/ParE family toxin [Acidiferrimicrobium sp. IK]|uniref:type II toxin-antitoxin system RelE/ParE family toxin n=1 Tax=Acidiferrimicrobium sp. IK TaxID=2871700 RepID=UPI0021CB3C8A|nr:type II toxin-antitoxin system RelE/ParE family toxin [Acidiferrimicrobium sp. IK]MCU4183880.1 type II toxin-antitoxin system RelE/ParE family toxin [Acidiferrimicrobium sp. IK]
MWLVVYLPGAERERAALSAVERAALHNAVVKPEALGPALRHPHTSAVQEVASLRELRPRAGRSPWRALYRQVGERFVIAAITPEALQDPPGLRRACSAAEQRLSELKG